MIPKRLQAKLRILAVDDEPFILGYIEKSLSDLDAMVLTCSSPMEALELVKRETFDIVILDILMPEMNGIELCIQIKKLDSLSKHSYYNVDRCPR